jgi:hypothetical protein
MGEEIFESVKRRSRNPECGSCGATEWMIQDGKYMVPEVDGPGSPPGPPSGIPVYASVCAGCGLIRFYSTLVGG